MLKILLVRFFPGHGVGIKFVFISEYQEQWNISRFNIEASQSIRTTGSNRLVKNKFVKCHTVHRVYTNIEVLPATLQLAD